MKTEKKGRPVVRSAVWLILAAAALLIGGIVYSFRDKPAPMEQAASADPAQQPATPTVAAAPPSRPPEEPVAGTHSPAPGAPLSADAIGDGKSLEAIRQWAHNELEVQRMLDENDRIFRRQRVMLKETVAAIIERNRLTGESIRELVLPGLDGEEIRFEIKNAEISPSGLRGTLYGHVAGRPDSMVTLAFLNLRQAYTVLSPSDNLYLDAEPHSDGDVIVKSIDVDKYGAGLCGVQ